MARVNKRWVFSGYPANIKLQCYSLCTFGEISASINAFPDSNCVYYKKYRQEWKNALSEAQAAGLKPCTHADCGNGCPEGYQS